MIELRRRMKKDKNVEREMINLTDSMKHINPEHINTILELINNSPYFKLLDMKVCDIGIGYAKVEIDLQGKHLNPFGAIHGGVYSSLIDTAAYLAIYCELGDSVGYTTIDLSINNLSMISEGRIIVEGRSIKVGRSICLAEAAAKDERGKLLAYGTSKLMLLEDWQFLNNALKARGIPSLPPKFV